MSKPLRKLSESYFTKVENIKGHKNFIAMIKMEYKSEEGKIIEIIVKSTKK